MTAAVSLLVVDGVKSKRCSACLAIKPTTEFYSSSRATTGLMAPCKKCHIVRTRQWQAKVGDRFLELCREYRRKNPEKGREQTNRWRARNPEMRRQQDIRKRAKRSESIYADNKRRTMQQKRATPPWADMDAITEIYLEARRLTVDTGIQHHVDHIIPLNGKMVSGLHVETNLRVIPAVMNLQKGAKFEESSYR